MLIRNRIISLIYRIVELGLGLYTLVLLFLADRTDANAFQSLVYFGNECMFITVIIVFLEVIFNAIDLARNGKDGVAAYVYMPLTLAVLAYLLSDALVYNISAPLLGGYATGEELFVVLLAHIVMPLVFLLDYLLFMEKGTVHLKHVLFSWCYPIVYFALIMSAHYIFQNNIYPYPFLNDKNFQNASDVVLSGNKGWNGVLMATASLLIGMLLLSFLFVFLNNLLAGKYKKR